MKSSKVLTAAAVALLTVSACASGDGTYPSDDIEFVIPYDPGGGADPVGREFSSELADEMGVRAMVENLPGGGETIGIESVLSSEPDGYRLALASLSGVVIQPLVNDNLSYEGPEDYTPILRLAESPDGLFVPADSPYETLDDLVADARANPGAVSVAGSAAMNATIFSILELERQEDIDINLFAMSGGAGEAVIAALAGEIDAVAASVAGQIGMVEGGELRMLAHNSTPEFNDILPGAVSFEEQGIDIPFSSTYVIVAPAGLDDDTRSTLQESAMAVASSDGWEDWAVENGLYPDPLSGDELTEWLNDQEELYATAVELAEQADVEEQ